jgi:hypothetical protein
VTIQPQAPVVALRSAEVTYQRANAWLRISPDMAGPDAAAQDVLLSRIAEKLGLDPVPVIDAPPGEEPAAADPED